MVEELMLEEIGTESLIAGLGAFGMILGLGLGIAIVVLVLLLVYLLAVYIFTSLALMTVAKKTKTENAWFAWLPILRELLMVNTAKLPIFWFFILLILKYFLNPYTLLILFKSYLLIFIFGSLTNVLTIYVTWKIAEAVGKPGWYSLILIVPFGPFITWYLIAWKK